MNENREVKINIFGQTDVHNSNSVKTILLISTQGLDKLICLGNTATSEDTENVAAAKENIQEEFQKDYALKLGLRHFFPDYFLGIQILQEVDSGYYW